MTLPNITPPNRSAITAAIISQKNAKVTANSSVKTTQLAAKAVYIDNTGSRPMQL